MNTTVTAHQMRPGGRSGARRVVATIAVMLLGLSPDLRSFGPEAPRQVTVHEESGVYRVAARFEVPQRAEIAFAVLTDYEQIPRFMPDVRTSIVRERSPSGVVVEQEAVARMMMFSKRIYLRLDVHAEGGTVSFRDSSARSFARYEGMWRVAQLDDRTAITYDLNAQPCFDVPAFLLTRLLKRDASQMIDRLRREIAARIR